MNEEQAAFLSFVISMLETEVLDYCEDWENAPFMHKETHETMITLYTTWLQWRAMEHNGDCIGAPCTCLRCMADGDLDVKVFMQDVLVASMKHKKR